ncbi:MAG: hypothetical protein WCR97_02315 [Bacilli bacterium]
MKINKFKAVLTLSVLSTSLCFVATTVAFYNSYFSVVVSNMNGQVGIVSYFDGGTGTSSDPYIIDRPRHLYNLSKLQSLGAFSNGKKYFQIGKAETVDGETTYKTYGTDATDATLTNTTLDMSEYTSSGTTGLDFTPIGSHGAPFMSEINGGKVSIQNLTVIGTSDDIGFFGYCDSNAKIESLVFDGLTIDSRGYNTSTESNLYSSSFIEGCSSSLTYNSLTIGDDGKIVTDTNSTTITDTCTYEPDATYDPFDGKSISITLPTDASNEFSFKLMSANELLVDDGNGGLKFNKSVLNTSGTGDDNAGFLGTNGNAVHGQIYILAQKTVDLVTYSHVVDSFACRVVNTITTSGDTSTYTLDATISKDTENDPQVEYENSKIHKQNVGLMCGHLDGTLKNSYVYNGTILTNNTATGYGKFYQESDLGMVGQLGDDVNNYNMNASNLAAGDVGYMWVDELHDICAPLGGYSNNFGVTLDDDATNAGGQKKAFFYYPTSTFANHWNDPSSPYYSIYQAVFKCVLEDKVADSNKINSSGKSYTIYGISSQASNNVNFKTEQLISGGSNTPLGIFSLLTSDSVTRYSKSMSYLPSEDTTSLDTYIASFHKSGSGLLQPGCGIGNWTGNNNTFTIGKNRALYVADEFRNDANLTYTLPLSTSSTVSRYNGNNSVPTYTARDDSDTRSVHYPTNITLYEVDLDATSTDIVRYFGSSYFTAHTSTTATYLKNVLEDTLVNYSGQSMSSSSPSFGITLRYLDPISNDQKNITAFSYFNKITGYLSDGSIKYASKDVVDETSGETVSKDYFYNKLAFSLKRKGNVTIVIPYKDSELFTNNTDCPYVIVCKNSKEVTQTITDSLGTLDPTVEADKQKIYNYYATHPVCAMPYPNQLEDNNFYYYPTSGSNTVDNNTTSSFDGDAFNGYQPVFVHTFKLDAGDYYIGTNAKVGDGKNGTASMSYAYIAVEGQEEGKLSNTASYFLDTYKQVCHLYTTPTLTVLNDQANYVEVCFLVKFSDIENISNCLPGKINFLGATGQVLNVTYNTTNYDGGVTELWYFNIDYGGTKLISLNGATASNKATQTYKYTTA